MSACAGVVGGLTLKIEPPTETCHAETWLHAGCRCAVSTLTAVRYTWFERRTVMNAPVVVAVTLRGGGRSSVNVDEGRTRTAQGVGEAL